GKGEPPGRLPAVLGKNTFLPRHPGRIVAETQFSIFVEVAQKDVAKRRARGGSILRTRSAKHKRTIQVIVKDLQLVVVVFSILFYPVASFEHIFAPGLGHASPKLNDLRDTAGRLASGEV